MVSAPPSEPEIIQLHGLSVPVDRRFMSEKIINAMRAGRYEGGEANVLPRLVRPGERVVEVGAGVGVLTALVAKITPAELVVAIEANPGLQDYIAELHRLNGAQTIVRQALVTPSQGPATAKLYLHEDFWASSPAWISRRSQIGAAEVPVISVAEIAETWRPSLLIVDVEPLAAWTHAQEPPHALAGADFRPFERVLLEVKAKQFPPASVKRVFDHFSSQGFAYAVNISSGSLVMFERLPAQGASS